MFNPTTEQIENLIRKVLNEEEFQEKIKALKASKTNSHENKEPLGEWL